VPKRHVATCFDATDEEIMAIHELVKKGKELLDREYSPDGYNLGVNVGEYGGQTVMHLHVHLIPRYCFFERKANVLIDAACTSV